MHIFEHQDWLILLTHAAYPGRNRPDEQRAYLCWIADCAQRGLDRQFDLCRVGYLQEVACAPKEYLPSIFHQQHLVGFEA